MAVPAHDERDFEFATKYKLPIVATVGTSSDPAAADTLPFVADSGWVKVTPVVAEMIGVPALQAANNQISSAQMKELVIGALEKKRLAEGKVTFRIRDWLFSRQRYWGEPIPLLHFEDGTIKGVVNTNDVAAVKAQLPLGLPAVPDYLPSSDGTSPLAKNKSWVECTVENKKALRETNTMPNWAGSCWYYLRYLDPKNDVAFADPKKMAYWLPVDRYFGGSEHTTLHLLYSRFWHQFLYDQKQVPTPEPYAWRMNGGTLLGSDNQKMSKSIGNVVNPDDKVLAYGADALRLYICFMGPYDGTLPWSEDGLKACRKLVRRIFDLEERVSDAPGSANFVRAFHKCVKRISSMLDNMKANTAVSEVMILVRAAEAEASFPRELWLGFIKLIAPLMPFGAEELWARANKHTGWKASESVHLQSWPTFDEALARDDVVTLGVQVNGKVRDEVELGIDADEASVRELVLARPLVQKWIDGKAVKKFVYVKGRIVSVVVG